MRCTHAFLSARYHNEDEVLGRALAHLLLVVERPGDLVVVSGSKVDHDVLVAEEEHDGARVVQLVHVVEVGHLSERASKRERGRGRGRGRENEKRSNRVWKLQNNTENESPRNPRSVK